MRRLHPAKELVERMRIELQALLDTDIDENLTNPARQKIREGIAQIREQLAQILAEVDPVRQPTSVFDPSEPSLMGRFAALAMVAQDRAPLADRDRFYGSGIYALYYHGDFDLYEPISGKETPIYVGKADPQDDGARDATEQGERLVGRLNDHRRNVGKAENLDVNDFTYRALVVQSGWQGAAESYLINLFKPVWNREVGLIYGFGKHGDAASTRSNKRSPWDTLHTGRAWAGAEELEDAKDEDQIRVEVERHLKAVEIFSSLDSLLDTFVNELRQVV